jgi:anti-anti-sigma factor
MSATLTHEVRDSGVIVIAIEGTLDALGAQEIDEDFTQAITQRAARVVIDLSEVDYMSSSGLAMLLVRGRALRESGGDLAVAAPSPRVVEVFAMAGFHEVFGIYDTVGEALASLEGS